MSNRPVRTAALLTWIALLLPVPAGAATLSLSLTADPSGRWFEYFSDAFAQIDGGPFYPGGLLADGFYQTSQLPVFVPIGGGAIVFPNGADFADVGTLTIDDSAATGIGAETAPITGFSADFARYISDNDAIIGLPYTTTVTEVVGNASLVDGAVDALDFVADLEFTYDFSSFGGGSFVFAGALVVADGAFDLDVDSSYDVGFPTPLRYVWDFSGAVSHTVVPEPSTAVLASAGLLGLALRRRRWQRTRAGIDARSC